VWVAGGEVASAWASVPEAMWKALAHERADVAACDLAALATLFGWADVLAAAGGVGGCTEPERLADLPALADQAGTVASLELWMSCAFGLRVRVEVGARGGRSGGDVGPPAVTVVVAGPPDRLAVAHPDRVSRLATALLPAHVEVRGILVEEEQ
jgi:hypothetical protein